MDKSKESVEIYVPDNWKGKTLEEARDHVNENKETGSFCPCCGQYAKVYYRKFNRNMARFLISLAKKATSEKKWVHYSDCDFFARDYAGVTYWGLLLLKRATVKRRILPGTGCLPKKA